MADDKVYYDTVSDTGGSDTSDSESGITFYKLFRSVYQVTRNSASILSVTETIDVYVYKALKENANYGFSAAASLLQNLCGCILMLMSNAAITKYDPERGLFR